MRVKTPCRFALLLVSCLLALLAGLACAQAPPTPSPRVPLPMGTATYVRKAHRPFCPHPTIALHCDEIRIDGCAGGALGSKTAYIAVGEPTDVEATGFKGTIVYAGGASWYTDGAPLAQ